LKFINFVKECKSTIYIFITMDQTRTKTKRSSILKHHNPTNDAKQEQYLIYFHLLAQKTILSTINLLQIHFMSLWILMSKSLKTLAPKSKLASSSWQSTRTRAFPQKNQSINFPSYQPPTCHVFPFITFLSR
jgi:hypothetical protein